MMKCNKTIQYQILILILKIIFITLQICCLNISPVQCQNFGTIELKRANNTAVFLREVRDKTINQNGHDYIIGLKDPETGKFYPYKTEFSGTGFSFVDDKVRYLITVKHLAENLTDSSWVKFSGARSDSIFLLKDVLYKIGNKRWYFSENTDIAIGRICEDFNFEKDTISYTEIKDNSDLLFDPREIKNHFSLGKDNFNDTLIAPFRDMELLAIGYPSGIGNYSNPHTTISKFFRASSDIIDKESNNPFFIIDDPSVDGFSGSPTFEAPKIFVVDSQKMAVVHKLFSFVGMINGTFNDANGGKFTSIIPSKLIIEELKKAKNIEYISEEFYKNGNLWQGVIKQNEKIIEVLYNYDKKGILQDKGTLKNGNGTIKYYDEDGRFIREIEFKNGLFVKEITKK